MRLWSIHPKYLDTKGLVACWRESLLAKTVLSNKTKGYKFHPQLYRFISHKEPKSAINQYLAALHEEAVNRGYSFDKRKVGRKGMKVKIKVTSGQIDFEISHLKKKLWKRNRRKYFEFKKIKIPLTHPLFKMTEGEIEIWER